MLSDPIAIPGEIFLFDCWYGPSGLTDCPTVRVKGIEDVRTSAIRAVGPETVANKNLVKVHYQFLVIEKAIPRAEIFEDPHVTRYLFRPEIESLLNHAGLRLVAFFEWMSGREPGSDTWSVCFVSRR
jgi:hypothetical protein